MKKIILLSVLVGCIGTACATPAQKPNIIIILADDMGYDSVAALNPKCKIATPNLDRMMSEGMSFSDGHSSSAVCSPTRYALLTGRYNWRSRLKQRIVQHWEAPLIREDRMTIGHMLQQGGYDTACFGKWHLGNNWPDKDGNPTTDPQKIDFSMPIQGGVIDRGFDYYYGVDTPSHPPYIWIENDKTVGLPTENKSKKKGELVPMQPGWDDSLMLPVLTEKVVSYIRDPARKEKPFFIYYPMNSPHTPIAPSKAFQGKGETPYVDFVMETDWSVGQIMQELKNQGIDNNTLVFFTADNGTSHRCGFEELEEHNIDLRHQFRGQKSDIFDGGHRVPFFARWPGKIPPGSTSDQVICVTDFMATCAELSGFQLPDHAGEDSVSLLPVLTGKQDPDKPLHDAIIHHSITGQFSVRKGRWKVNFCAGSGGWSLKDSTASKQGLPPVQLYDIQSDPLEQNNLQAQHPEIVQSFEAILKKYVTQGRSTPGSPQLNEDGNNEWAQLPWVPTRSSGKKSNKK